MKPTKVKICCISSIEEALTACKMGASAVGLVGDMPSGPGIIDDALIREIAAVVPADVATFLLTSRSKAGDIVDHVRTCGTSTVQIVKHIEPNEYKALRARLPDTQLVQVLHVEDEESLARALAYEPFVDALLLDSGRPKHAELGGTGRTHDWTISAQIVAQTRKPVYLAGGLNPENVAEAIRAVQPYGLDLCSGVRTDERLDTNKLRRFIQQVSAPVGH